MGKVLIIEDEAPLLDELVQMLRFEGFEVFGALDGVAGVQMARDQRPDLIVSDILMPELDGYGVLLALQDDPETRLIPFIFLTGKAEREHQRYGMELGADDYITKPFKRDDLLAAIHTRLDVHHTLHEDYAREIEDLRQSLLLALPHELRTPLTGLVGYSELLMTDCETLDPEQIIHMARMLQLAGQRLKRQIENFLLYAQLDMVQLDQETLAQFRVQSVATPGAIIDVTSTHAAAAQNRDADLVVEALNMPVQISPDGLQKIITELVDNACKFSRAGTPVRVTGSAQNAHYTVTVSDQGRGMSPDQLKRTGPYMQFERRLHEQQGTGLGLALASRLASLSNGTLTIHSTKGAGTQVVVELPLAQNGA
jgi:two-component system, sensor histidine kinase and response regulator